MRIKMQEDPVIKKADSLPPLRRGGNRNSAARQAFVDALKSLDINVIEVEGGQKEYNATQQRIRTAASSIDMAVTIRQEQNSENPDTIDLYFEGRERAEVEVIEETPKTKAKAPTKRKAAASK